MFEARGMVGEVAAFAAEWVPEGWEACDGRKLSVERERALFDVIGTTFGGDGRTSFAVPDLRGRMVLGASTKAGIHVGRVGGQERVALNVDQVPPHRHALSYGAEGGEDSPAGHLWTRAHLGGRSAAQLHPETVTATGEGEPHENMPPFSVIQWMIRTSDQHLDDMQPMLGEIRLFAGSTIPKGWTPCDGRSLPVEPNAPLFMVVVNPQGSSSATTFRLPDLGARFALGAGQSWGRVETKAGDQGGAQHVTLGEGHLPWHDHRIQTSAKPIPSSSPQGLAPGAGASSWASRPSDSTAGPVLPAGGGGAHDNMPPHCALSYLICTDGPFPSRA